MEIKPIPTRTKTFMNVEVGDVLSFDGSVYMRIFNTVEAYNVVKLGQGSLHKIDLLQEVVPHPQATLTLE